MQDAFGIIARSIAEARRTDFRVSDPHNASGSKYGAFDYSDEAVFSSYNLGDEIQTLAAIGLLPRVDAFLNREGMHRRTLAEPHKTIFNGWFLHRPENWPPKENVVPLLVSMHITQMLPEQDFTNISNIRATDAIFSVSGKEFLQEWGPVGARDLSTLQLMQSNGIESYFSGCLTLTLPRRDPSEVAGCIICVDTPDAVYDHIRHLLGGNIVRVTHDCPETNRERRLYIAERLLLLYRSASVVVTSRLHCALPCLAMGVPVIFLDIAKDGYRMDGLREFLHCAGVDDIVEGRFDERLRHPLDNKDLHLDARRSLIERVKRFVEGGPAVTCRRG